MSNLAFVALGAVIVLAIISAAAVIAVLNGISAVRTAANADLRAAAERMMDRPDEAALLAVRALNTVTEPWLLAPFLGTNQQRVRDLLGTVKLPHSDIKWLGSREAEMKVSPDGRHLVVWAERSLLAVYDATSFTEEFRLELPDIEALASVDAGITRITLSNPGDRKVVALTYSGKITLRKSFNDKADIIPLGESKIVFRSETTALLERLISKQAWPQDLRQVAPDDWKPQVCCGTFAVWWSSVRAAGTMATSSRFSTRQAESRLVFAKPITNSDQIHR